MSAPLETPLLMEKPGRSPANRSLLRGIEVLRAFRPGSDLLGNGELAERTGLAAATVTRLTQTLVSAGMLQLDRPQRAYRLAPAVLSLAHAMRSGSHVLALAAPLMREAAESGRINVGLAAADRDEMVYLESIRYNRRVALRNVVSGQRVPMELTSLGRAYLSTLTEAQRKPLMRIFERRNAANWPALRSAIHKAVEQVGSRDCCSASWQPEVMAVATPLPTTEGVYVLNVSVSSAAPAAQLEKTLVPQLRAIKREVVEVLEKADLA